MRRRSLERQGRRVIGFAFGLLLVVLCSSQPAQAENDWAITLYTAALSSDTLGETVLFSAELEGSYYLTAFALSRRVGSYKKTIDFEVEGQVVKHFGKQDHMEFNGVFVARWLPFPWDKYLDTTLAVGEGLSLATETPKFEIENHEHASSFLNYLLIELAFSLPRHPNWSFVTRIHHRSGAFGLFDDVRGASNAVGIGLRYSF